jgi:hypothetical protein
VLLLQRAEFAVAVDDYKFKGIWMNSNKILCAIALGSFIGGIAHARGIRVDGWQSVSSGNGLTATVDNDPPLGPTLAGIQLLSFSSGTSLPGFSVATFTEGGPEFFAVRYEWDAVGGGVEQVVIDNTEAFNSTTNTFVPTGQFSVSFGYSFGTDDLGNANGSATAGNLPEVASLSVNGVTYTTKVAPNSLNGTDSLNSHDDSIFNFSNGVLTNGADIARGWSSTAVSAPEINPSSAGSALTLLMGCLAVLGSRSKGAQKRER